MNKLLKIVMCAVFFLSQHACGVKLLPYSVKFYSETDPNLHTSPLLIRTLSYNSSDFEQVELPEKALSNDSLQSQEKKLALIAEANRLRFEYARLSDQFDSIQALLDTAQETIKKERAFYRARKYELRAEQARLRQQLELSRKDVAARDILLAQKDQQIAHRDQNIISLQDQLNDISQHVRRHFSIPQKSKYKVKK